MAGSLAAANFTRDYSDVPGPITATGPNKYVRYLPHASGLCTLAIWRPATQFTDAPVQVFFPGGLGFNPGGRAAMDLNSQGFDQLAAGLNAKGFVVVSVQYPTNSSNRDDGFAINEIYPVSLWPKAVYFCGRAIQFIRDNWSGATSGPDRTLFGQNLWGAGNTISPIYIATYGNSWGATIAYCLALLPDARLPYDEIQGNSQDTYRGRSSHRTLCAAGYQAQIDMSQLVFETRTAAKYATDEGVVYPLGEIYCSDRAQFAFRTESSDYSPTGAAASAKTRKWSTEPLDRKLFFPWWLLQAGHAENTQVAFWGNWPKSDRQRTDGSKVEDADLTYLDFNPGVPLNTLDRPGGIFKSLRNPHHEYWAKPWGDALAAQGTSSSPIRKSIVRWGTNAQNPGGFALGGTGLTSSYLAFLKSVGFPNL